MTPAGTLLLAAELSRIIQLIDKRRISCSYPMNTLVAQVLQHVGIFEMLGQKRTCDITADDVKFWRVHSGTDVDGERAGEAILSYGDLFSERDQAALFRGLVEAMTNTHHHAYKGDRGDGLPNVHGWWMFLQSKDGQLSVVICDLGIGIPRSLRENQNGWFPEIVDMIATQRWTLDDGVLIKAAIAVGRSRTGKEHRGKGLHDIRTVLDRLGGTMQIHSNRGSYFYDSKTKRETCSSFRKHMGIPGTLVMWQVPVPPAAEAQAAEPQ